MFPTCYPSHRQKKGGGAKKAHPEIPALSSWNFYYWFVPLLPRSSPQKERKTREKEARKRRIRVERTCDATVLPIRAYICVCLFPTSASPPPFLSAFQAYWQSIILIKVCGKSSQKDRTGASVHGPRINVVTWTRTHLLLRARACVYVRVRPIRAG